MTYFSVKTCNFPNSATIDDIRRTYIDAWEKNCKGLTVYRDGSRTEQVLELHEAAEKKAKKQTEGGITLEGSSDGIAQKAGTKRVYQARLQGSPGSNDCPECATAEFVVHLEGCVTCTKCGWSKC